MSKPYKCIDSGSKYCPCHLVDTMDCISCSQLRGEVFCDCQWNGVCILYEYYMKNQMVCDQRLDYESQIVDKINLDENLFLIKIKTDNKLIKELDSIGSYIFIRKADVNTYHNTPMSVFNLDEDFIYVVYQAIGPKTKGFNKGDSLILRGPYWSGIVGEGDLSKIEKESIVIVARGIGQSSILIPLKKLIHKKNKIVLFLDEGKLNSLYCLDYVDNKNVKIVIMNMFDAIDRKKLEDYIKHNPINIVFSAGSDMVHREIKSMIEQTDKSIRWFVSNNNILCCGEGLCGSCIRKTKDGDRVKLCKTVIDPRKIY
ncbi:hypothetical protein [Clostridium sp. Cult3]|uniref:hypothetical protein n=1 Tax=Clostridium sp. Cult3 TaxID=2079004 RepID=UPI001F4829B7|nr:hypothetical protein [Clostridium sp. Cult3]MCF6459721.1 hypothetical protein [Clostridium sp. Cult3]